MAKEFHRAIFEIEVLSDMGPIPDMSLHSIDYEITHGHYSGVVECKSMEEVTPQEMAKLLIAQGSDPEFFMLDDEGNEIEED